ncbi:MAG: hypothetical protein EBT13_08830 [Rhodobacteraceae bacterium]|nr:hypothetical protein [Paracoccaceae bacterium]
MGIQMSLINFMPALFRRNDLKKSVDAPQNRVTRSEISAIFAKDLGYQRPFENAKKLQQGF